MSMVNRKRAIETFRLPPELIKKLVASKFSSIQDVEGFDEADLAKECNISLREAALIIDTIKRELNDISFAESSSVPATDGKFAFTRQNTVFTEAINGLDHLSQSCSLPIITTFNKDMDSIMSGGVQLGRVTEFCGVPGIGKTQIGIQLAVNAFIPAKFGGCEGRSIYIDTEGSFMSSRVIEITNALLEHLNSSSSPHDTSQFLDSNFIMKNMFYYRVLDKIQQIALIGQLPQIVSSLNANCEYRVRCIVIDTISFLLRGNQFTSATQRNKLLSSLITQLSLLAAKEQLALVILNQVSMKKCGQDYQLSPVLDYVFSHAIQTRVFLDFDHETSQRRALILKSSELKSAAAHFSITSCGIR